MLAWASTASAVDPAPKCQAGKNKEAGKYAFCRQKAEAGLVSNGDSAKYDAAIEKCDSKFLDKWASQETKAADAGATCPDEPLDPNSLADFITAHCEKVAEALAGEGLELPAQPLKPGD